MMEKALILAMGAMAATVTAPVLAKESLGIFGDWGAFRDKRGGTVCYVVSAPSASTGKGRRSGQLVVSRWPGRVTSAQVMIGAGSDIQNASLRVNGQSFKLVARGEFAWLADAEGDALAVAALSGGRQASVDGKTTRGNRFNDSYTLSGLGEALATAQKACGSR
jgi:hypothetical protein